MLVTEGQKVTAGTPLFKVDSPAAETAVQKARSDVEGFEKQLSQAQKDLAGLNLTAPFSGKIMLKEYPELRVGEEVGKGTQVAELNDDTRLRLEQYYSYAYAGELYAGQTVNVSIPALMTSVPGTVEAVHMVSRITPEGSKLFSAEIVVNNEGSLTADMAASATATVNGETVYPYEQGKLEYYRTTVLTTSVGGTVLANNLVDYLQVSAGQVLVQIDAEQSESELFTIQQSLETAKADLEGGGEESGQLQRHCSHRRYGDRPDHAARRGDRRQYHCGHDLRHLFPACQRQRGRAEYQLHQGRYAGGAGPVGHAGFRHCGDGEHVLHRQ